jgi:hypothetical protein
MRGSQLKLNEVRLTDEQATLCRTLLCQELMKVSNLLASNKDCNGRKLIDQTKQSLMVFSSKLQLTLPALGMTSKELADIVKGFQPPADDLGAQGPERVGLSI